MRAAARSSSRARPCARRWRAGDGGRGTAGNHSQVGTGLRQGKVGAGRRELCCGPYGGQRRPRTARPAESGLSAPKVRQGRRRAAAARVRGGEPAVGQARARRRRRTPAGRRRRRGRRRPSASASGWPRTPSRSAAGAGRAAAAAPGGTAAPASPPPHRRRAGQRPGQHRVEDALAGQRVDQRGGVAGQQHPAVGLPRPPGRQRQPVRLQPDRPRRPAAAGSGRRAGPPRVTRAGDQFAVADVGPPVAEREGPGVGRPALLGGQ